MAIHDIIDASPTAAVISDPRQPDNPIIACNDAFVRLTGYAREEIVGRNCRFLSGPETEPELTEMLRDGIRRKQPVMVEILNYKKDGSRFRNAVMVAPIFDDAGELEYFLGSQMEVVLSSGLSSADRSSQAQDKIAALTGRQREILEMMSAGQLNKQIAYALGLSERTVKMHRAALLKALDVKTSADAIRLAVEAGL
ncbi:PAS domain-containing protein [Altererythrobacter fulvus]|uniref:PAS domain-containing protein n=1 Tax=Caenibius fulvus TaxID=2126012 RepID=UPI0030164FA5